MHSNRHFIMSTCWPCSENLKHINVTKSFACRSISIFYDKGFGNTEICCSLASIRGLLEKYPTFGREKETGLLGALDT